MKKLYVVTIKQAGYVLAESEQSARKQSGTIEKWEKPTITCELWPQAELEGWDDGCCCYTDGREDVLLEEAKRISRTK